MFSSVQFANLADMDRSGRIHIHVRGPLRLLAEDGQPLDDVSRRGQALLVYLALSPSARAERTTLADLLWGDRGEVQARASLRQELSVLRRALPDDVFDANRQQVWLVPGKVVVDQSGDGEVLQGFDIRAEAFEDWLRQERQGQVDAPQLRQPRWRDGRPTLAVMPFQDFSGSGTAFGDGVVEDITLALSRVHDFDVIARQSVVAAVAQNPRQVADALGADYLVEGSIRAAGERVRIAVQMIDAADGRMLWSERFDDLMDDLFDLQDRIAAQVAGQLSPRVRAAEIARAGRCSWATSSAYELHLTALPHFWAHTKSENAKALGILTEALARDRSFVPAIAYKAWALGQQPSYMWSDDPNRDHEEALSLAREIASKADDHAPSLVALSAVHALSDNDPELSHHYARRALEIDPNNAWGWMRLGWAEHYRRPSEEAVSHFDKAMELSPLDPFFFLFHLGKSATYRELGQLELALEELDAGFRANPGITWALRMYVGTYTLMGEHEKAAEMASRFLAHYPHVTADYLKASWPPAISQNHTRYNGSVTVLLNEMERSGK